MTKEEFDWVVGINREIGNLQEEIILWEEDAPSYSEYGWLDFASQSLPEAVANLKRKAVLYANAKVDGLKKELADFQTKP